MIQVLNSKVVAYYAGSTTATHTPGLPCVGISITNDGASSLTFTINSITITVKAGENFSAEFDPFTSVTVTTSVAYRLVLKAIRTS